MRILCLAGFAAAWPGALAAQTTIDDPLARAFRTPPAEARPQLWWHWVGGNVNRDGVDADLAWMRRIGIGGVHIFDVNLPQPHRIDPPLRYMTPSWIEAFRGAVDGARKAGLTVGIASSPGWSETGGPWVAPADAMKKLVWRTTEVRGGRSIDLTLPALPDRAGPMQDAVPALDSYAAAADKPHPLARDVALLAIPVGRNQTIPQVRFSASFSAGDGRTLRDGTLSTGIPVPAGPGWIRHDYSRVITIRSATLGRGAATLLEPSAFAPVLEADTGQGFRRIATFAAGTAPQQTLSFPPVTARRFRLRFIGDAGGSRMTEFRLSSEARVNRFEDKAGFGPVADPDALATPPGSGVAPESIVNLSGRMTPDGRLRWIAPPGRWRLMRLGWSLTGKVNHPAVPEATGLEVDKLDPAAVERYLNGYLDRMARAAPLGAGGISTITLDSIEVGAQNWTPGLIDAFRRRRGYDPLPFLPAMTGTIVGDASRSDKFLFDLRHTLGDLLAEAHYGTIARTARTRGITVYGEAMEFARTIEGDDMTMRAAVDVPMAAMWAFAPQTGPEPTALADMRGAASIAHLNGRPLVAAELLTSIDALWRYAPADLRPMIDRAFAAGINLPVIHSSVHQPGATCAAPGLTLGVFGQTFNRCETWAGMARPWMDYIARTALLLRQGRPAADLLYFAGEGAPLVARFAAGLPSDLPNGNGWDFIDAGTLTSRLRVENGKIVAPDGGRYAVLWLGPSSRRMTLPVLRALAGLARQGAVIAGQRPEGSPSLADDPRLFRQEVAALWDAPHGRIPPITTPAAALAAAGVSPRYAAGPDVEVAQRHLADGELFFVVNRGARSVADAWFAVQGRAAELWRAEDGSTSAPSWRREGGGVRVALSLLPGRSTFILFRRRTDAKAVVRPAMRDRVIGRVLDWTLAFPGEDPVTTKPGDWTALGARARNFGGTARYTVPVIVRASDLRGAARLMVDLGAVGDVARVLVNGREAGIAWEAPWRVDATGLLHPGTNDLTVEVANLWTNRLVPTGRPRPSGLLRPVQLIATEASHDR